MGACTFKKGSLKNIKLQNLQNNLSSEGSVSPTLCFQKKNEHTIDFNYFDEVIQSFNMINESYLIYYNHISNLDKVNQNSNSIIVQHILTRQIFIAEILDNNEKLIIVFHYFQTYFIKIYKTLLKYIVIANNIQQQRIIAMVEVYIHFYKINQNKFQFINHRNYQDRFLVLFIIYIQILLCMAIYPQKALRLQTNPKRSDQNQFILFKLLFLIKNLPKN